MIMNFEHASDNVRLITDKKFWSCRRYSAKATGFLEVHSLLIYVYLTSSRTKKPEKYGSF